MHSLNLQSGAKNTVWELDSFVLIWESDNGSGTVKSKMSGDGVDQDIAAVMGFSGFGEDSAGRAELAYDWLHMS